MFKGFFFRVKGGKNCHLLFWEKIYIFSYEIFGGISTPTVPEVPKWEKNAIFSNGIPPAGLKRWDFLYKFSTILGKIV